MAVIVDKPTDPAGLALEAWAQGMMFGSLVIMAAITIANMRPKVLLHKLILIELIFGMFQGTFIFPNAPVYGWYLSAGGVFLNLSWSLHNVIAWMKNKPFLSKKVSLIYIITVIMIQPYWIIEMTSTFLYFNNINDLFTYTRPLEALFRDPWWIFTTVNLFWNIKRRYDFGFVEIIRVSPRFGVLIGAMLLSMCFILLDILSVTHVVKGRGLPDGLNPFWKFAFIFKCLTDTVVLDDFKTALDRLKQYKMEQLGSVAYTGHGGAGGGTATRSRQNSFATWRRSKDPLSNRQQSVQKAPSWEADVEHLSWCTVPDPVYREEAPRLPRRSS